MGGVEMAMKEVTVRSARRLPNEFHKRGFAMYPSPTHLQHEDFFVHDKVVNTLFPECEVLLQSALGASLVLPFDYIVRSMEAKDNDVKIRGGPGQGVQGPAFFLHADYTLNGAPRRLKQLAEAPKTNDNRQRSLTIDELARAGNGHWCFVNVWRNISDRPVAKSPLAVCDSTSVVDSDLCCLEQRYVDRTGENYIAGYNPSHSWYFYPKLTRDEALLLKTWDSREVSSGTSGRTVSSRTNLHTAFLDPSAPTDAPERESIEVRCLCVFD